MIHPSSHWIEKAAAALTCLVFTVGLCSFALIGTTSRYLQDDFCYSVFLRGDNFLLSQYDSYMLQTAYSANRYSLTLGMGLSELAGPGNVRVLPGLMLAAWVIGLYALLRRIFRPNSLFHFNRLEAFIAAEALALFTLTLAPNWIQVFFWRPGMFPYFAPLVTGTYLILLMLAAAAAKQWRPLLVLGVFLLAVLTGGFSETAVCIEIVLLAIVFGLALIRKTGRAMRLPAGVAFLGSAVALALLIASPMNGERLANAYGSAASLQSTITNALGGAVYFYAYTAYRPTLFYASALVFFGLLGLVNAAHREQPPLSWKPFALALIASILIAYLLTAAAMAPSFYAESSYPGKRALVIPSFVSVLLAACAGFLLGNLVSRWRNERRFTIVAVLAGAAILLINALWLAGMAEHFIPPAYPDMRSFVKERIGFVILVAAAGVGLFGLVVYRYRTRGAFALLVLAYLLQPALMSARILDEYTILRHRAGLWDLRQSQIITARDNGERELTVQALDSLAGLTDLSKDAGYWVNNCAADYYGLTWIRGVEPVLFNQPLSNP